jgi:hypothetical protein
VADDLKSQFEAIENLSKFAAEDSRYLQKRQAFAEEIGVPDLWPVMDHFGTYVGVQTLASRLAVYEIMKQVLDVPGNIIEFGVWNGSNLLFMAKTLSLLRPRSPKKLIGFDSFEGLQSITAEDGEKAAKLEGAYQGDEARIKAAIELFDMGNWVHLVKGDALQTIPAFDKQMPGFLVSLAYIDFDLFEPCRAALAYLATHLADGGIIAFDEGLSQAWPGEGQAMIEFLREQSGQKFEMFAPSFARQPNLYIIKR